MKNRTHLILLALLIVVGAAVCRLWPRTLPREQCSLVYQRYADREGLRATFIKDKKITDTIRVDVTLLEATDSAGWDFLLKEFKIPSEMVEEASLNGTTLIVKLLPDTLKSEDAKQKTTKADIMTIHFDTRQLFCFHINTDEEYDVVYHKAYLDMVKQNQPYKQ